MRRLAWWAVAAIGTFTTSTADAQQSSSGLISVVRGADQSNVAGYYTIAPLVVEVRTAQGVLAIDASVVFTVSSGAGVLTSAPSSGAPGTTCLLLHTDSNGLAAVYFMPQGEIGTSFEISVIANQNSCDFSMNPPIAENSVVVSGQTLDPAGDDDNDGKINGDELKIRRTRLCSIYFRKRITPSTER